MLDPAITELADLRPLTPYSATKAAGDVVVAPFSSCPKKKKIQKPQLI